MSARVQRIVRRRLVTVAQWSVVYAALVAAIIALALFAAHFAGVIAWPSR